MPSRKREVGLSYGEEQATAWLSWLARGMQKHGQTVFLIEQLQPSWLSRWQLFGYVLGSRLAGSLLFGVAFGIFGFWRGLQLLVFGLTAGAIGGLFAGLIEFSRLPGGSGWQRLERANIFTKLVLLTAIFSLAGGLGSVIGYHTAKLEPTWELRRSLFFAILFSLLFGTAWGLRALRRGLTTDILPADILTWSWTAAGKSALPGVLVVILVLIALSGRVDIELLMIVSGLVFCFALITAAFGGLKGRAREMSTVPNQGIMLSMKSGLCAAAAGPVIALTLAVFLMALALVHRKPIWWPELFMLVDLLGLIVGIIAALRYGGMAVIQHYLLRFILYRRGDMPWRCVRFLDYAAEELGFLQKVGGGYMFVHRYLLEHFADRSSTSGRRDRSRYRSLATRNEGSRVKPREP